MQLAKDIQSAKPLNDCIGANLLPGDWERMDQRQRLDPRGQGIYPTGAALEARERYIAATESIRASWIKGHIDLQGRLDSTVAALALIELPITARRKVSFRGAWNNQLALRRGGRKFDGQPRLSCWWDVTVILPASRSTKRADSKQPRDDEIDNSLRPTCVPHPLQRDSEKALSPDDGVEHVGS